MTCCDVLIRYSWQTRVLEVRLDRLPPDLNLGVGEPPGSIGMGGVGVGGGGSGGVGSGYGTPSLGMGTAVGGVGGGRPSNLSFGSGVGIPTLGVGATGTTGGIGIQGGAGAGRAGMPLSPNPSIMGGVGMGGQQQQQEMTMNMNELDFRTLSPYAGGLASSERPGTAGSSGGGVGGVSRNLFVGNVSTCFCPSVFLSCRVN